MRPPRRLWYCEAHGDAVPVKCKQIGKSSRCDYCLGELLYVLQDRKPRKKK
jgi:hypothetical protein